VRLTNSSTGPELARAVITLSETISGIRAPAAKSFRRRDASLRSREWQEPPDASEAYQLRMVTAGSSLRSRSGVEAPR
jgi:hypothetical protein